MTSFARRSKHSGVWRRGEIGKGWDCNTSPRRPHSKHVRNIPSHSLLQVNYCTRNSRNNAIVLRPLRAIASHELLQELLRWQRTIAATPLAESTPSPNTQSILFSLLLPFWHGAFGFLMSKAIMNLMTSNVTVLSLAWSRLWGRVCAEIEIVKKSGCP